MLQEAIRDFRHGKGHQTPHRCQRRPLENTGVVKEVIGDFSHRRAGHDRLLTCCRLSSELLNEAISKCRCSKGHQRLQTCSRRSSEMSNMLMKAIRHCQAWYRRSLETSDVEKEVIRDFRHATGDHLRLQTCCKRSSETSGMVWEIRDLRRCKGGYPKL